jgi:C4-dicarboxylate transporter, DctQ subunit
MLRRVLAHLEEWLIAALMGAATGLIFIAVLHRYVTGIPVQWLQDALLRIDLSWAQELCIYMFVWMAKFGAAYGVRTGIHVGVDVLINSLPPGLRKIYVMVGMSAGAIFTGIVGTLGASFVWSVGHTSSTSPDLEIPKWIVYLCVPLGSYLMCFRFLEVAWHFARTGELPHHDVAHVEGVEPLAEEEVPAMQDDLHPLPLAEGARP